jgi:hypothetical protein
MKMAYSYHDANFYTGNSNEPDEPEYAGAANHTVTMADWLIAKNKEQRAEIVQLRQQVADLQAALTECQRDQSSDYSDDFQRDCEDGKLAGAMGA